MADPRSDQKLVDDYVRGGLSEDELANFELRLMEDEALQAELEIALAIRNSLSHETAVHYSSEYDPVRSRSRRFRVPLTMAASVAVAVISLVLFWRATIQTNELRHQLAVLSAPSSQLVTVPLDIKRSYGSQTPDAIIEMPTNGTLLVLEVELPPNLAQDEELRFTLKGEVVAGHNQLSWLVYPKGQERIPIVLREGHLSVGRMTLIISSLTDSSETLWLIEVRSSSNSVEDQ